MSRDLSQLVVPPVFVVGLHRSGTTWVFDLLSFPPTVAGVFESWLFTPEFGLGALLRADVWAPSFMSTVDQRFGRTAGIPQLVSRDEVIASCRSIAERWLGAALQGRHRYLVEKSPQHLFSAAAICEIFPEARFVHVLRDGRDVTVSTKATRSWGVPVARGVRAAYQTGKRWSAALAVAAQLKERIGDRFYEIRYEQLKDEPHRSVTELYRFCGLEPTDELVGAALRATDFDQHYVGGYDQFRRAGRTGDWRHGLSLIERFLFQKGAGDALIAQNYERTPLWWAHPRSRTGNA